MTKIWSARERHEHIVGKDVKMSMQNKHKAVALLLSLMMVLTMVPSIAFAEEGDRGGTGEPVSEAEKDATENENQDPETPAEIAVTGITLDKTEVTVEVKKTEKLTATVSPENATDKTVTWTSSDEKTAKVADGEITAVAAGETTITAAAGGFKAECKVTVDDPAEPPKDKDGIYEISTAEQLAWIRDTVNSGRTGINVKLMNDIDLSEICGAEKGSWEPIGRGDAPYKDAKFDGQGYTIENLYYNDKNSDFKDTYGRALFGRVKSSEIRNLTVTGEVTTSDRRAAGLTGYSENSTIENCHTNVDISRSGHSAAYVDIAGIVAETREENKIINCSNSGDIKSNGNTGAGGIVGIAFDSLEVTGCINTGNLSYTGYEQQGGDGIGGIVAAIYFGSDTVIKDCYNTGKIIGSAADAPIAVGGIVGNIRGGAQSYEDIINLDISSCYNIGKLITAETNKQAKVGGVVGGTWVDETMWKSENNYYLSDIAEKDALNAEAKTADEMKSDDFITLIGSGFKKDSDRVNKGYPLVSWQKSEYIAETDVTINKTEAVLWNDDTLKLIATVAPKNATYRNVDWTSSNEKIAKVNDDGLVTPVKAGEVTITATTDKGLTAECKVTVKEIVRVVSVKMNKSELYMFDGDKVQLSASVKPASANYKDITWESSNKNIAYVDKNGLVRATGAGMAVITAEADGIKAECNVMVSTEDGDISAYYDGLPFSKVTCGDGMYLGDITETKAVNHYSGKYTAYQIVIPEGITEVKVTMPSGKNVGGAPVSYNVSSGECGSYDYDHMSGYPSTDNGDGTKTVTIPTTEYTDNDTGTMLQTNMWYPSIGFSFVTGEPNDLADVFKIVVKGQLDNYADPADYRDAEAAELEDIIKSGKKAIDELDSNEKIKEMMMSTKAAIDELKTAADYEKEEAALEKAKEDALAVIAGYDLDNYRIAEKIKVFKLTFSAENEIRKAETTDEIAAVLEEAKAALDAVKTDSKLKAEAVAAAEITLTAKAADYAKVKLSWNEADDADKYEVYRATSKNGEYSRISTTAKTAITNTKNVKTGRTYYYKVRAFVITSEGTVYSDYSKVKYAKPVLAEVTGVKAKAGTKKITVSWSKVKGADGYKVYKYDSKAGKYKAVKTIKSGKTVKWTNSKLKKGKTYSYKVKAYRTVDGKKVYSPSYSKVAKAKTK